MRTEPSQPLRVLVTGGAGFLGSHLCERLRDAGHDVLCVDNFYTGTRANVASLLAHPRFELLRHDITFPLYVEVDRIFNLACPASPRHYQADPVQTTKTSVHGAINLLGLAKRLRAPILQASTSEVYGDPAQHQQTEEYWGHVNPIGPRACYDEGKRCAETLFADYRRQHGVVTRIARIFNTYGPRMQPADGRVVSNFIVAALRGEPLTIQGDGWDALVLLRERHGRRAAASDGCARAVRRSRQHRQSARIHGPRARRARAQARSLGLAHRLHAGRVRRSAPAQTRHRTRDAAARLDAAGRHRRGACAHHRLLSSHARSGDEAPREIGRAHEWRCSPPTMSIRRFAC